MKHVARGSLPVATMRAHASRHNVFHAAVKVGETHQPRLRRIEKLHGAVCQRRRLIALGEQSPNRREEIVRCGLPATTIRIVLKARSSRHGKRGRTGLFARGNNTLRVRCLEDRGVDFPRGTKVRF
jgi:hypothetical protein